MIRINRKCFSSTLGFSLFALLPSMASEFVGKHKLLQLEMSLGKFSGQDMCNFFSLLKPNEPQEFFWDLSLDLREKTTQSILLFFVTVTTHLQFKAIEALITEMVVKAGFDPRGISVSEQNFKPGKYVVFWSKFGSDA